MLPEENKMHVEVQDTTPVCDLTPQDSVRSKPSKRSKRVEVQDSSPELQAIVEEEEEAELSAMLRRSME